MTRKERFRFVIDFFEQNSPEPVTELVFSSPYQLLVAVILSAQCTDKRVNMHTPELFRRYPDPAALARAEYEDLFSIIKSISFPGNKTRHLIGTGKVLMEQFGGAIPMSVEKLVQLPGVGRKTAHVITSVVDQQPNMAVDTHVFRVSARIGLTAGAKTPLATEKQLMKHVPDHLVHKFHHWLVLHGRYICVARNPRCAACGLRPACRYYNKVVALQQQPITLPPANKF